MKIICVGRNYVAHIAELGNKTPDDPVLFMKPKTALINLNNPFYFPDFTNELHYECELVLRVSKNGKFISERNALNYVNAISVGIDFTARDVQNQLKQQSLPWEKAKAFDQSALVGKFKEVTPAFFEAPVEFSLYKNEERVQLGNSSHMIYNFSYLIHHITSFFTINIGDLIFTGTPAGVGECSVGDELRGLLFDEEMFSLAVR